MDIKSLILKTIKEKGKVKSSEIMQKTGFSREYVNRHLQELRDEGKIKLIGKTNQARYVLADKESIKEAKKKITNFQRTYKNEDLSENSIFDELKDETGILLDVDENIKNIFRYAFTEMVNNAIDHSQSEEILVKSEKSNESVTFEVIDYGIGIFNNIMNKKGLDSQLEAIQDLLKGKQTTDPERHSGEGIFFTSKAADTLTFKSGTKKLIFNNRIDDIFIKDIKSKKGTKVIFSIDLDSDTQLDSIFNKFTAEDSYDFSKTSVVVNLFKVDTDFVSRSQARRVTTGLEKFEKVILDFDKIENVGQAFADEIFRVWQNRNPDIEIEYKNANENAEFMIKRAKEKLE